MKKIFFCISLLVWLLSFSFIQVSFADYSEKDKRSWLNSDQWRERKETYCDGECDDEELIKQDWQDGRWLWKWLCNWIKLNTDFPIIGNCIELKKWSNGTDPTTVMPNLMWSLMKIIMSIIMVVCFIMIILGGIYWASNDPKKWREMLKKAAVTVLLLWLSGVILKVINPTFFS